MILSCLSCLGWLLRTFWLLFLLVVTILLDNRCHCFIFILIKLIELLIPCQLLAYRVISASEFSRRCHARGSDCIRSSILPFARFVRLILSRLIRRLLKADFDLPFVTLRVEDNMMCLSGGGHPLLIALLHIQEVLSARLLALYRQFKVEALMPDFFSCGFRDLV